MRFDYEYRTCDNVKHAGTVEAPDRDAAYKALKTRGINPSRVIEAPGFFNKLFGKGKRWLAIAVLTVICVVALSLLHSARREVREESEDAAFLDNQTRRQIIGDTGVIEKGIKTGWEDVFPFEGERFLASFAVPGVPAGQRSTTEDEIRAALGRSAAESIRSAETNAPAKLSMEARQIVAIVEGMKSELRNYIADGSHSIVDYGRRLVIRQDQEIDFYRQARKELDAASANTNMTQREYIELWESLNSSLRRKGIKLVPLSD